MNELRGEKRLLCEGEGPPIEGINNDLGQGFTSCSSPGAQTH